MTSTSAPIWRRCSNCKGPIPVRATYWLCSVASCSKVRAPVQFCKPDCWAVHEEIAFHKNAWAVEHTAPSTPDATDVEAKPKAAPTQKPASTSSASSPSASSPPTPSTPSARPAREQRDAPGESEALVVVSRLKELIRAESGGMSTSDQVVQPFSAHVRRLADRGIESARQHGRKTMLDRDIPTAGTIAQMDVLVVVSKLKDYVRRASDLRTSDDVALAISHELRRVALWAIENARKDGRKTVMGRDVPS